MQKLIISDAGLNTRGQHNYATVVWAGDELESRAGVNSMHDVRTVLVKQEDYKLGF